MRGCQQKIFSIHFPEKRVYIENTCKSLHDKMEYIKNDKDHLLYPLLKDYPDPEVRFECFQNGSCNKKEVDASYIKDYFKILNCNKKEVANKYIKNSYKILNVNLFPPTKFSLFQSLYKWIDY